MSQNTIKIALTVLITALAMTVAIYLTPLKHINLVEPTIHDIDGQAFHEDFQANPDHYLFIDVRPPQAYADGHAVGSVNIPLHEFYDQRKILPKTGKEIVLICSGGRASGVAYSYLEHFGFLNVRRIEGGIEAWSHAGLPVETSK